MSERRCPSCGALVAVEAEWCGQCYASLRASAAPAPAPGERPPTGPARDRPRDLPDAWPDAWRPSGWRCPTCETENAMDRDVCRACGTPLFGRLFEGPARPPSVSPAVAAVWSLLLPGVGHWIAGRRADAVARFVLAGWVAGTLIVLLTSRGGRAGLGSLGALVTLFGLAVVALWAESAVDAHRAASGVPPLVSSRMLLWASVGLVALSIVIATMSALPSLRLGGTAGPIE